MRIFRLVKQKGQLMYRGINTQSNSLQSVLSVFFKLSARLEQKELLKWIKGGAIFTGCGTTYALSSSAAVIFNQNGFSSNAIPASEISFHPESIPQKFSTLIAFSRSGETSEILWAVESL